MTKFKVCTLLIALFIGNFSLAQPSDLITENVLLNVAPGLMNSRVISGVGKLNGQNVNSCLVVVKEQVEDISLIFVSENKFVGELTLAKTLKSFEDLDGEERLEVSHNQKEQVFSYYYSIGTRTNQYIGANDYELEISKSSPNSFHLSYLHAWADDDGGSGQKKFECDLKVNQ